MRCTSWIMLLVSASWLIAAPCVQVDLPMSGFGVCVPPTWDVHKNDRKHALFLCTRLTGRCVSEVGGDPEPGTGTIGFVEQLEITQRQGSLSDWAQRETKGSSPIRRRQYAITSAAKVSIRVIETRQLDSFSLAPTAGLWTVRLYVEIDQRRFVVSLAYNDGDPHAAEYNSLTKEMIRTLRLNRR